MGSRNNETPKGIYGCENTSFGAKIVKIGAIVAEISRFFDIFKKAAVRHLGFVRVRNWTDPPKLWVLGLLSSKLGGVTTRPPKGTNGCENTPEEPSTIKITPKL